MAISRELFGVSIDDITAAVRQQTGNHDLLVTAWTSERLFGGGEALGVWRLSGTALFQEAPRDWSIVLKAWAAPTGEEDPAAFNWPHREMELYRSGLLEDLPGGIRAPACSGSFRGDDGSLGVWLEDVTDGVKGLRTLDDYAMVARRLGQFNGAWVTERPLPSHPALSRNWARRWIEAGAQAMDWVTQVADNPLVQRAYPPHILEIYRRVWTTRQAAYALLERSPRTLAHMDVFPHNIFIRNSAGGPGTADDPDIVLIDWSYAGIAGLGEEAGPLVLASAIFLDNLPGTIDELQNVVLESYIEGLRDAGWHGDAAQVIACYRVSALLRYGPSVIRVGAPILLGHVPREQVESIFGKPFDAFIEHIARFQEWAARQIREHESLFG